MYTPHRGLSALVAALFVWVGWSFAVGEATGQTALTVAPNRVRAVDGVQQLDRARYFNYSGSIVPPTSTNLGNLRQQLQAADGLNLHTGRIATELDQFISSSLPEDPSRPGFIAPNFLKNKLLTDYRNFVLNGTRWEPNRNAEDFFFVQSGRHGTFFPSYFYQPGTGFPRVEPYVEFLNTYVQETLKGPNAFLPVDLDRFHLEILNEPDLHLGSSFTTQDYLEFHRDVTAGVKAVHPDVSIGGPSLAVTSLEDNDFARFENNVGALIDQAGMDYISIHPYERYSVLSQTTFVRDIEQSPGRIDGLIDLIRNRDELSNGKRSPIAFTEYGSFNRTNTGDYNAYPRDQQQWDQSRAIRQQLLLYLDRPDTVLNATPFVAPKHFSNETPTPDFADNVFWEQDAAGQYSETILGMTFRAYNEVRGTYIGLENSNRHDLQSVAFRDGDKVHVLMNNLLDAPQTVDLGVLGGLGTVQSAKLDRLFRENGQSFYLDDVDVTGSFQSLTLNGNEGAVLTLTLAGDPGLTHSSDEQTFYGDQIVAELNVPTGRSPVVTIYADIDPSTVLTSRLRVSYNRPSNFPDGEGFEVLFNGTLLDVPTGIVGIDDEDFGLQSREIAIDPALLLDGDNTVQLDFFGTGGFLSTAALVVTSDTTAYPPGDYNRDGTVDTADYDLWTAEYGSSVTAGLGADGNSDGVVDAADYTVWRDSVASASRSVPEPATGVVALVGLLLSLGMARSDRPYR